VSRRRERPWFEVPRARWAGGNRVRLLEGGDQLFPAMVAALHAAAHEVWLATYIFEDDDAGRSISTALAAAARRGVAVHVVVDGFGALRALGALRQQLVGAGVRLEVFRPIDRWWRWLQPGQLRRLHQKLCVVDGTVAFVGGINIIDDRWDLTHGRSDTPRLDYAVEVRGPLASSVRHAARAMWGRAHLRENWREELGRVARSERPMDRTLDFVRALRTSGGRADVTPSEDPVRAAFVVRDNFRQRRSIEGRYIEAMRQARDAIDIACPYFYPGRGFRRALRDAARRGVKVRLLLQGKVDYPFAALAARVLYDELRSHGVRIFEYTPAFLHAKVARVDDDWATVGSSNIDPLSLLLNLEANAVVRDGDFARELVAQLDQAFAASVEVKSAPLRTGWRRGLTHGFIAWCAGVYLRMAGVTGRY
jgi:cardiolipin synthase